MVYDRKCMLIYGYYNFDLEVLDFDLSLFSDQHKCILFSFSFRLFNSLCSVLGCNNLQI